MKIRTYRAGYYTWFGFVIHIRWTYCTSFITFALSQFFHTDPILMCLREETFFHLPSSQTVCYTLQAGSYLWLSEMRGAASSDETHAHANTFTAKRTGMCSVTGLQTLNDTSTYKKGSQKARVLFCSTDSQFHSENHSKDSKHTGMHSYIHTQGNNKTNWHVLYWCISEK